ncbi:MAG TPA: DEAD/DEAH box helicase [Pirellulales bacterium]|nr:DEAD/DEAH box helicase [Pirellulales bacterium]
MDLADSRPEVLSVPLNRLQIKTHTFTFPHASVKAALAIESGQPPSGEAGRPGPGLGPLASGPSRTRFKPPGDIVKLKDRLHYVLQPSLETLLTDSALHFPFVPFTYQFEGVAFLFPRVAAVLADEMGLGKTMQAITAIRLLIHSGEMRSVLLVCPKPLVTNWQREFTLWAPELPLAVIEGEQEKRRWQWQLPDAPIKIANYEALNRDRRMVVDSGLHFDLVVLDESQRIKNRNSTTSQVVRSISRTRSWALTGTPVENSPDDLVGIFEFVAPGHLSPDMKPRSMGRAAGEYVLRRTKDKVLTDLPPKLFRDAELELTPEQRQTYELAEDEGVLRLTEMGDEATIHHVFELVLRLKQICNFDPATGESAKLERLAADLEEVAASGQKAIVFSQWVQSLQALGRRLRRFGTLEYHGQIPSRKRDAVIEQFRDDPRRHVLLISYGAGGVGLNLQFAGYVFLFDRWWNPAVEDQAINRAHRIGAAGPVTVCRFLTLDTIEQRINQILEEKREIFDTIFSDTAPHLHSGLTQQEVFSLFKLRCPHGPIDLAA